jgi:hypothetical protein
MLNLRLRHAGWLELLAPVVSLSTGLAAGRPHSAIKVGAFLRTPCAELAAMRQSFDLLKIAALVSGLVALAIALWRGIAAERAGAAWTLATCLAGAATLLAIVAQPQIAAASGDDENSAHDAGGQGAVAGLGMHRELSKGT